VGASCWGLAAAQPILAPAPGALAGGLEWPYDAAVAVEWKELCCQLCILGCVIVLQKFDDAADGCVEGLGK
jgi:hypothetical protein